MAKELTVREMARMGGVAKAKAHTKAELLAWGKQGGRPAILDRKAQALLVKLLSDGTSQAKCSRVFGVSVRTIGRAVARLKNVE
jgi:hypothetical protein